MTVDWERQLRDDGLSISEIKDTDSHHLAGAQAPPDEFTYFEDMNPQQPSVLSLDHDQTLTFAATNWGVSTCLPFGAAGDAYDIGSAYNIPMGYSSLVLMEKRAVVHRGRLLRLWPGILATEDMYLLLPPIRRGHLMLEADDYLWHALRQALDLSARTDSPILLASTIDRCDWH